MISKDDDETAVATLSDYDFAELKNASEEQIRRFLVDFLKKIIRLKGVRIDRDRFLRSELRKKGVNRCDADLAVSTTPVTADIDGRLIDDIAREVIDFETKKSTAFSFSAGLPGGAAMVGGYPRGHYPVLRPRLQDYAEARLSLWVAVVP